MGTMDYHKYCLAQLCRLCRSRAQTARQKSAPAKLCTAYKDNIRQFYQIDISMDNPDVHPNMLCEKCYRKMLNAKCSQSNDAYADMPRNAATVSEMWIPHQIEAEHDITLCVVCYHFHRQCKGGGQTKIKRGPRVCSKETVFPSADTKVSIVASPLPHTSSQRSIPVSTSPAVPDKKLAITQAVQTTPSIDNSLNTSLNRSIESPLSQNEEKLHTKLTKRKLSFGNSGIITCKTGGQPLIFKRITKARKQSNTASLSIRKRRAGQLGKFRQLISGHSAKAQELQQAIELSLLTKNTRVCVCANAGVQHRTFINKRVSLAMKTSLNLTWSQMRKQKRYLKTMGVSYESEKSERSEQQNILQDCVTAETVVISVKNDTACTSRSGFVKEARPLVKMNGVRDFVLAMLNQYQECNKLVWQGSIPDDEVWIKIGGDHGGSTFKMCFQVLNTHYPNSKENTVAILCHDGRDYRCNLETILVPLNKEISSLQNATWQGKRLRVFMCGDYDFLCKVYGLSGARGSYCCLWCTIETKNIQVDQESRVPPSRRKLSSLKHQYRLYITEGKRQKKNAAKYRNSIHAPIFDIRLNQVCPPYLHILLGITKRHHDLLELECHELDKAIAIHLATTDVPLTDSV